VDVLRLTQELDKSKANLKDINEFLTNELKARALTTAALEHQRKELTQELADSKAAAEVRVGLGVRCFGFGGSRRGAREGIGNGALR